MPNPSLSYSVLALALLGGALTSSAADEVVQLEKLEVAGTADIVATQAVGTKSTIPLIETPQAISVVTRDEIDLRNVKSVGEALRYTSGVTNAYYGEDPRGYDWVKVRGFETFDSQYLDGLRLFNYELTEAFGLERVEVMKGPSSVLYGQSTPGGLINSVSRQPLAKTFADLTAEVGTNEHYEATVDLGGSFRQGSPFMYRLTGLFHDNDEDSNGYKVDAKRYYLAPALTWNLSDATTLTILSSYTRSTSTQFASFVTAPDGSATNVYLNDPNWDYEGNTIYRLGYQFEHRINANLVLRQNARMSSYDVVDYYLNPYGYEPDNITLDRSASIWRGDNRAFAADTQAEWKLAGSRWEQTLLGGVDYAFSSADTHYYEDPAPSLDITAPVYDLPVPVPTTLYTDTDQRNTQTGLYAQDQLKFDAHWIITLSGRYDWASSDTEDRLAGGTHARQDDEAASGRAGLSYLAQGGWAPYLSYSTSFYPNSGTDVDGKPFDPTEGRQYEVGLKYSPAGSRASATLSLYDLTQKNVLTADPLNIGYSRAAGEWRSRGIELEGKLALASHWDWIVGGSYDDIEITRSDDGYAGNVPYLTPKFNASTWLDYTMAEGPWRGLTFGAGYRYVSSSYGDDANTVRNGGYGAVDLVLRYRRGAWRYALNVGNLFDDVQLINDAYGFYLNSARTVRATVGWHF